MNTPWLIGLIASIAYFSYFEWRAFKYPSEQNTLSRTIYDISKQFPLSIWFMGIFAGGLAVHFFWHWSPDCMAAGVGG